MSTPTSATNQSRWPVNGSVAAWPTPWVADRTLSVAPAVSPPLSPCDGFEPGSEWDGSFVVVVVDVDAAVVVVTKGG
jgi:hypothetical protein